MQSITIITVLAAAVLAGCASQPSAPGGGSGATASAGKHLVYRDASGKAMRQFDYPSDDLCRRVEAMAGRAARCQAESAGAEMQAQATLRYNPPGMMVQGHYADLARCRQDTTGLGPGVELVSACSAK